MTSDPGASQEHDGRCVRNYAWEEQLWEQQEQLEKEMLEARRMVSSLQVTCVPHFFFFFMCIDLNKRVHLEITVTPMPGSSYLWTKLLELILWMQSGKTKIRNQMQ